MKPDCYYCGEELETPCEPCDHCHKYVCIDCDLRGPECRPCQDGLASDSEDDDSQLSDIDEEDESPVESPVESSVESAVESTIESTFDY